MNMSMLSMPPGKDSRMFGQAKLQNAATSVANAAYNNSPPENFLNTGSLL
jgi:hypothetical protein